ncbi:MAG: patatin-like phospholipase family protein [Acidaminococcaceae bacterium]
MRPKLGLALGAGGMRGFAHIGVLSVLEENNLQVDMIAGTSIGGLMGAFIAAGYDAAMIIKLAKGLGRDPWLDFVMPKMGFISTKNIHQIVELLTKQQKMEELKIPLATVATDLKTGREVVFKQGNLADAVCASLCVPGVFEPFVLGEMLLADGALVNPTPVNIVKEMGAEVIIAVDLAASDLVDNIDSIYSVIIRALDVMEKGLHRYQRCPAECDVLLRPNFLTKGVMGLADFKKIDEGYEVGRQAALDALPAILAALERYPLQ